MTKCEDPNWEEQRIIFAIRRHEGLSGLDEKNVEKISLWGKWNPGSSSSSKLGVHVCNRLSNSWRVKYLGCPLTKQGLGTKLRSRSYPHTGTDRAHSRPWATQLLGLLQLLSTWPLLIEKHLHRRLQGPAVCTNLENEQYVPVLAETTWGYGRIQTNHVDTTMALLTIVISYFTDFAH